MKKRTAVVVCALTAVASFGYTDARPRDLLALLRGCFRLAFTIDLAHATNDEARMVPAANAGGLKIFFNGKIFAANGHVIENGGVAVSGNIVIKVGSSESVLQLQHPGDELIDLGGKVVLPGFNDAHDHPFDYFTWPQFGKGAVIVNDDRFVPAPGHTFAEVLAAVQAGARANPAGTWLIAFIGTEVLADRSVNRLAIDEVAADHPVLLATWFGHGTFLNTKAIETVGFSLTEPDPPGGFFGRFPNGELSGEVREYAELKDDVKGSLAPFKAADLVVLDRDIFMLTNPRDLLSTRVLLTMVNGDVVFEVPGGVTRSSAPVSRRPSRPGARARVAFRP